MVNLVNIFRRSDIELVGHPNRTTVSLVDNKDTSILRYIIQISRKCIDDKSAATMPQKLHAVCFM